MYDVLTQARALIRDPRDWCPQVPTPDAICAVQAVYAVTPDNEPVRYAAIARLNEISLLLYGRSLPAVNGTCGHAAVLRVFDAAIREEEVRRGLGARTLARECPLPDARTR